MYFFSNGVKNYKEFIHLVPPFKPSFLRRGLKRLLKLVLNLLVNRNGISNALL